MDKGNKLSEQEVKRLEVEILNYIVSVCQEHNLTYFLAYGTLLGAVRHKGFIPWDDDVDIWMPTEDYDKFIKITRGRQGGKFRTLTAEDTSYYYAFAKVVNTQTHVEEPYVDDIPQLGIWVDVFPLGGTISKNSAKFLLANVLDNARISAVHTRIPPKVTGVKRALITPIWVLCRLIGYRLFLKLYMKLTRVPFGSTPNVCAISCVYDLRHSYPQAAFEQTTRLEFEGKLYNAPSGYKRILEIEYGDYMTLPPESERRTHIADAYWIEAARKED